MTTYTDVAFTFRVTGLDLTTTSGHHVTFSQGSIVVDTANVTIESATQGIVTLTQAQTGLFKGGRDIKVQLNYFVNGERKATPEKVITVADNLLKRVLKNG